MKNYNINNNKNEQNKIKNISGGNNKNKKSKNNLKRQINLSENNIKLTKENDDSNDNNLDYKEDMYFMDSVLANSLEYYDSFQPEIIDIISKTEYIEIVHSNNSNDTYILYDKNDNVIIKSRIEHLAIYIPNTNIWKWSWSVPFIKHTNTFISRKILEYAFSLDETKEIFLKSTLTNSNIDIDNSYQIDIYLALSSFLSKKPFILKMYLIPNDPQEKNSNRYQFRKFLENPEKNKYISTYVFLIDWNK
jgi:hypothetical protein